MDKYLSAVKSVLQNGTHKHSRTAPDTVSEFGLSYKIDLTDGFPLLTTKKMDGVRWNSLVKELEWFLSGEPHIQNLRGETSIWDEWGTDAGELQTAYGRFWRQYPIPDAETHHSGESWVNNEIGRFTDDSDLSPSRWVSDEQIFNPEDDETSTVKVFDQLQYVLDMLSEKPHSRRLVVSAWHPANATVSKLPPCHYTFAVNVQGDGTLNTHLTQRSGDIALGVPFNIASYSLLTHILSELSGFSVGSFSHQIIDAHAYCGTNQRGDWYADNLEQVQETYRQEGPESTHRLITDNAPEETLSDEGLDHIPGLLTQLSRTPHTRPSISVDLSQSDSLSDFSKDDVELNGYQCEDSISFSVAE